MTDRPSCATCKWFDVYKNQDTGLCRIRAPQTMSPRMTESLAAVWPEVDGKDWCGEHHWYEAFRLAGQPAP